MTNYEKLEKKQDMSILMPAFIKLANGVGFDKFLSILAFNAVLIQMQSEKLNISPKWKQIWAESLEVGNEYAEEVLPLMRQFLENLEEEKTKLVESDKVGAEGPQGSGFLMIVPPNPLDKWNELVKEEKVEKKNVN